MPIASFPTLSGIAPSWADIQTTYSIYDGELIKMADFADISLADTVEVGEQRGAGSLLRLRTTGSVKQEAKATFFRSGFRQLVRGLMKKAPARGNQKRISLVHYDILIQHTPPGEADIYSIKIKGCRVLGRSWQLAEGNDADKVEVQLHPMQIVEIIDGEEVVLL